MDSDTGTGTRDEPGSGPTPGDRADDGHAGAVAASGPETTAATTGSPTPDGGVPPADVGPSTARTGGGDPARSGADDPAGATGRHAAPEGATAGPGARAPEVAAPAARASVVPATLRIWSEVSARLVLIALGLSLLIFLVVQLRVVVIPFAIAVLLAALLSPVVYWLVRHRVPRGVATVIVLIGGLALIGALFTFVINTLVSGFSALAGQLTTSIGSLQALIERTPFDLQLGSLQNISQRIGQTLQENQQAITSGALSTAATLTEVLTGFALTLFSLIFLLYDGPRIWRFAQQIAPAARRERMDVAGRRAFASLVGYTRATVMVAVVDAVGIGIGLYAVGVPLAFPLAALVFVGAFVPTVGAVVTGVVAVLIALVANGVVPALIVLAVVVGVQQLEGHVLQPLLLGRAVQLHPLAVTLSVAAGVVVAGIAGALLAVPLLAVLTAAVRSLRAPHEPHPSDVDALKPDHGHPPASVVSGDA